ncbi:MAG: MFS transporter [Gemmatimonadetes bacterium]|nr:MFS transporter [Gemmatimonadota bacterium]
MPTTRGRLAVIFLTVLIDLIGFGIVIPILPYYAQQFGAKGLGFGLLLGAFSGMQFLATALLGRWSDRVGRRPIILATTLINVAGYLLFAYAGSYGMLLIARLISGFAGGNISAAQAYVADVTTSAERSKGMGLIGAAFGIGFTVGPAVGGLAGHYWGHVGPGLVASGLSAVNFVLAYRILPESLKQEHRTVSELWPFGHMAQAFANLRLRPLMVVWALAPFAFAGYTVALPLFVVAVFGWHERDLGLLFTVIGITAAVVQGWLFGRLVRVAGDRALLIAGTFGMAVAIAAVPFLSTTAVMYGWTVVLAFANSVFAPAATGMVSVLAGPAQQGTVLGVAQSLGALGRLLGPEAAGTVYDGAGAKAAFLAAAAIMALGGLAALGVQRPVTGASKAD